VENDSISETSPNWPTRWPSASFSPGWTLGFILLVVGVFFVALVVAGFGAGLWLVAAHHGTDLQAATRNPATATSSVFVASSVAQLLAEALVVALIVASMPRLTRLSLRQLGFRPVDGGALFYAIAGAACMILIADVGSSLVDTFTHAVHPQLVERIFENLRHNLASVAFFVAFAVVLQPIAEETIFRIFLFNLGMRYGGFWLGAIVSGALFGAAHVAGGGADPVSGVLLALGGMVLCWVYYRSRNAYASMISHGLFNAVSTAVLYFYPKLAGG
jgi:membrane protease YdiL (CAAX protease family)